MRLSNKVCIVTGGASGIGLATCEVFVREGAKVVIADRDLAAADKAVAALTQKGGQAMAVQCDVSNADSVAGMVQATVAAHGRLDVIVNNAGYGIAGSLSETSDEDWEALMGVNVRGVFLCCKHAIKQMQKNGGGTIVNVASVVAAVGIRNRAAYVASKGAVAATDFLVRQRLTHRSIALDYVASHIRCNAIAPGTIDTPYYTEILAKAADPVAIRKGLEARQPMGRLGTPEEIANGILFLASDESAFATGSILTIDGGMTAQ